MFPYKKIAVIGCPGSGKTTFSKKLAAITALPLYNLDLTLKTREGYFNYRVAGVIIKDDKILAQRNTKTNEYYLPGGRVVFGETSEEALLREIEEEL